jgi:beta-glucanase (GH16 family)
MTTAETGFTNAGECYVNSPNNVSVGNGYLSLTARNEGLSLGGCGTTGGFVSTIKSFSQAYGRFEIRAAFPNVKVAGVQSSLWMWPKSSPYGSWPTSGEIDIAEYYSGSPDRAIPYIHYSPAGDDPNVTNNYCLMADPSQFHTYLLEWTPQTLTVKFDGVTCISDNWNPAAPLQKPAPFDVPFFLNLTQGLGVYQNQYNPLLTPLPATTKVDYVRAWSGSF